VGGDPPFRAEHQERGRHLTAARVAQADEEHVAGLGRSRTNEGLQALPREAVRQHRNELADLRLARQALDGVAHQPLDRLARVRLSELLAEGVDEVGNVLLRDGIELASGAHSAHSGTSQGDHVVSDR